MLIAEKGGIKPGFGMREAYNFVVLLIEST
jgi:hypothetical protein